MPRTNASLAAALLALVLTACSAHVDERTNVTAGGAGGGITVSGTVDSFTSDAVVLSTATGKETLQIDGQTRGRDHLMVGQEVSIDALRRGNATVAVEIRRAGDGQ